MQAQNPLYDIFVTPAGQVFVELKSQSVFLGIEAGNKTIVGTGDGTVDVGTIPFPLQQHLRSLKSCLR